MRRFEFHAYGPDGIGEADISYEEFEETAQARRHAGKLCRQIGGPVDLARDGPQPWNERYITTAAPCGYRTAGYRLEKLDG